jgi:hypothetical protein
MRVKKSKRLLSIEFLDSQLDQIVLANYLSSSCDAKAKVLSATRSHFYGIALVDDPSSSDEDTELAVLDSVRGLWSQMCFVIDYYNIKCKRNLTLESLRQIGQIAADRSSAPDPVPSSKSIDGGSLVRDDEEDEYEFDETDAGIKLSSVLVASLDK